MSSDVFKTFSLLMRQFKRFDRFWVNHPYTSAILFLIEAFTISYTHESAWFPCLQISIIVFFMPVTMIAILRHVSSQFQNQATAVNRAFLISNIVLFGFFITAAYFYGANYFMHWNVPNPFSLIKGASFTDFTGTRAEHLALNPYQGHAGYPPLSWTLTWPLLAIDDQNLEMFVFIGLSLTSMFALFFSLTKSLPTLQRLQTTFILVFLSFPIIFLVDRGNMDLMILPLTFWSMIQFQKSNYWRSGFLLSLAIGMKIVPAIYLILFLARWKFKQIFFIIALAIGLNLISAALFAEGLVQSIQHMNENINTYYLTWTQTDFSIYGGHAFKGLMRVLEYSYLDKTPQFGPQEWHKTYRAVSAMALLGTMAFVFFRHQTLAFWKQYFLVTTTFLILPMFSPDYKMASLLLAAFLFIENEKPDSSSVMYAILFGLIFIPKEISRLPFVRWENFHDSVGIGVIINPLLLISFAAVIILAEINYYTPERDYINLPT